MKTLTTLTLESLQSSGVKYYRVLLQKFDVGRGTSSNQETLCLTPPLPTNHEELSGTLCVEIIRACGLLSAVQEAHTWLGSKSGVLSQALLLGPHAYGIFNLFPCNHSLQERMPPLQTPFHVRHSTDSAIDCDKSERSIQLKHTATRCNS